jgi:aerobic carbon-monoxide dehydrogenase medium subunit
MKAASFGFVRATSLPQVFDALEAYGDDAKLLAGGQSLVPLLNLRLAEPKVVIDITRLDQLTGLERGDGIVRIGALTTYSEIEHSSEIMDALPLVASALPHIAHPAIRNSGTLGGSIALADPNTEWPACCLALDATFIAESKRGARRLAAREFFRGLYATALAPDEVLTAVEVPVTTPEYRSVFLELARRRGDYALIGIAALARSVGGVLSDVRLAYLAAGQTPVLARNAMAEVEEQRLSDDVIAACGTALTRDLDPPDTLDTSAATKMHLARVLTARALRALASND